MKLNESNKPTSQIALIVNDLTSGGAQKQALSLTKILAADYNVTLIVFRNEIEIKYKVFIEKAKIKVKVLKGNLFVRLILLYYFLKKNNVEYVFTYLLTSNLLGAVMGKFAGVNYTIGGVRNAYLKPKKAIIEKFIHNYLNTKTIFNNNSGIEYYTKKGFKKEKILVIPNCIEVPDLNNSNQVGEKIMIISVGRFVKQKDYFSAIMAISKLVSLGYQNIHYTIIGFGSLEQEIREKIKEQNVDQYISIVINPSDINQFYKSSNIYLCTSLFEGLSNSLLEAMSFGLPIVATDVGDNKYLVEDNYNGYLVKKQEVNEISDSLIKLIKKPELISELGMNSYKKVKAKYSIEAFKENYLKVLNNVNNK